MARRARRTRPASYERRLILFLDFLGFSEIVDSTRDDPGARARLIRAMDDVGTVGDMAELPSRRVTQFSDTVVLSYRVDEESGVFWMLNSMALTVISLAERGYLLRGAVTMDDLHHSRRHVVGPALVRAYQMESRIARHPRVIVDREVVTLAGQHRAEHHEPDEERAYVLDFLAEDGDGWLFFDYLSWTPVVDVAGCDDDLYPGYLARIGRMIRRGLSHDDPGVLSKYLWLHDPYLRAIGDFAGMPPDAGYRLRNSENVRDIEALDRFDDLARHARASVALGRRPE